MEALQHKVLVRVNMAQKDIANGLSTAKEYEKNRRDGNPVMCEVVKTAGILKQRDLLLVHHNFFTDGSPYQLEDDLFSIKVNANIFARLDKEGNAKSIFDNIIAERIQIPYKLNMPPEQYGMYRDRVVVVDGGLYFKKVTIILHRNFCDYEIIYNWKGEERRVIKVMLEDVCGKIVKKV
jgi:hypothetical protein